MDIPSSTPRRPLAQSTLSQNDESIQPKSGSPTKLQLVESLDALKLSPSMSPPKPQATPSKRLLAIAEDEKHYGATPDSSVLHDDGTPQRDNKENTPSTAGKLTSLQPRHMRPIDRSTMRSRGYDPTRPLTPEELQKLADPKVKRLANVAQLCMTCCCQF